jgi:hypothetical protein
MATAEEIASAIACLSTAYPQFVAKELSKLSDEIYTAVQGFTDPLAAIADLNIDSIINGVAELSEGDAFENLGQAAVGLTAQYVQREAEGILASKTSVSATGKRIQQVQNFAEGLASAGMTMMSLFPDLPYAAAQRMCKTIIRLDQLKVNNLKCLRAHVVQLVNCVLVLVENVTDYKDETLSDLAEAQDHIITAVEELELSQPLVNGVTSFDQKAFERAREALILASRKLTPDMNGTSILDAVDILTSGSVEAAQVNRENAALVQTLIPSLMNLVQQQVLAVVAQAEVVNFYVNQLTKVIEDYRKVGLTSRIKEQRSRAIYEILRRLNEMISAMELVLDRGSITSASANMLLWSSRVKASIATMDELNQLTLQEGSIEGPDKALALETAFQKLLLDLTAINNSCTVNGIEDPLDLRDKVLSLVKVTGRILQQIESGTISENKIATLHGLAAQVAQDQVSIIDDSASTALRQIAICQEFAAIDLQVSERYDQLLDAMRQVGLDRAVDMLSSGQFSDFLESSLDELSYLGTAINCLTHALGGIDDVQTRLQISAIRDDMVSRRANVDLAAIDASDQGRTRFIDRIGEQISSIQKNAKTVEAIVSDLTQILESLGGAVEETFGEIPAFLGNIDHLAVGAGGRLASTLEEYSEFANAGVVQCAPT